MTDAARDDQVGAPLPDFANPPLAELALSAQFEPIFGLRPIELGALRDVWRDEYPLVQEQPALSAVSETPSGAQPGIELTVGPQMMSRLWFLSEDHTALIQLQHDRLAVNWRAISRGDVYPRYPHVRNSFAQRWRDLAEFVEQRQLGTLIINQVEATYINAVEPPGDAVGRLETVLRTWRGLRDHHLGDPEQARVSMVFKLPNVGIDPVRLYVAVDRGRRPDGQDAIFLTLTARGAPNGTDVTHALDFMDRAHEHLVRSFAELTTESMHVVWERRR